MDDTKLRVLTLNVWGLKFISPDRPPRIQAIIDHIRQPLDADRDTESKSDIAYDVVCLQELWIYSDYEKVRDGLGEVLPESKFFRSLLRNRDEEAESLAYLFASSRFSGALGSGLAIFSRFPIISTHTLPYALSGLPLHVIAGDFFVNKAAGSCVLLHPELGEVEVWSTHMHAANEGSEIVQAHRMAQAWQLADHIRASAERGRYVIAAGDYNSSPWSLPIAILKDYGCMLDSWVESHPPASLRSETPESAEDAIESFGMTCDSPINSYSAGKPLSDTAKLWKGKRLDYIFYRGPDIARRRPLQWKFKRDNAHGQTHEGGDGDVLQQGEPISSSMNKAPILTCSTSRVVLTGLVPGQKFSYSDHFGLCSTFTVVPADPKRNPAIESDVPHNRPLPAGNSGNTSTSEPLVTLDLDKAEATYDWSTPQATPRAFHVPTTKSQTINSALQTLRAYTVLARKDARFHLRVFGTSILFSLALTISSAWQPKSWIQPIWTLLGVAAGALGATMLYVGFVWGEWEQNLLLEVTEQMELELRVSELEDKGGSP